MSSTTCTTTTFLLKISQGCWLMPVPQKKAISGSGSSNVSLRIIHRCSSTRVSSNQESSNPCLAFWAGSSFRRTQRSFKVKTSARTGRFLLPRRIRTSTSPSLPISVGMWLRASSRSRKSSPQTRSWIPVRPAAKTTPICN